LAALNAAILNKLTLARQNIAPLFYGCSILSNPDATESVLKLRPATLAASSVRCSFCIEMIDLPSRSSA